MGYTTSIGYTPTFAISIGGTDTTGTFEDRLISIRVASYEGGGEVDTVDIEVDDRDWAVAEPSIAKGSATLQVSLGYREGVLYEMGTFQVDELHHKWMGKAITIHGNSAGANTSLKTPAIVSYEGKTLGEIVNSVAQTAGVVAKVDPSLANIQIPYLNQMSSFGTLLAELEHRFNGLAKFADGILTFTQRGTGLTVSGASLDVVTLSPDDVPEGDITSSNFDAYSKVRASYIDRTKNQLVWVESNTKGSFNSSVPYMMGYTFGTQELAQAAADSRMSQLNRGTKQGTITLSKGCPEIRGGSKVILSGFRSGIDDTYMVRCATHILSKDVGIRTTLDLYSEEGAGVDNGSGSSSTGEAPTTVPSLDEMAPEAAPAPQ